MPLSSGSYDPADASHRALRAIKQELDRHPIVTAVRGFPDGEFARLVVDVEPQRWGADREDTILTVRWFAGDTPDAAPEFSFHYSDAQTNFGWHYHDQDHVDGWGHYQDRVGDTGYRHEPHEFPSLNPVQLTWEVMSHLAGKLNSE